MRRQGSSSQPSAGRRIHEETAGKLPEPTGCPRCGASYHEGRWTWKTAAADAHEQLCPACERIESDYPAGVLHVEGNFVAAHRDELIGLIRGIEEREREEHPLKRVMSLTDEGTGFVVTVTDAKLAERFGRALKKAYAGNLETPPTTREKQNLVRVRWARD